MLGAPFGAVHPRQRRSSPLANINCTITYNPSSGQTTWSASEQPIQVVPPGNTPISWSIQLASGQSGDIDFSTNPATPGIQFTGTPAWPGTTPSGNANNWNCSIDDNIPAGGSSVTYHYVVNAVYTPPGKGANPQNVKWDPDVEENPPSVIFSKTR